MVTQSLQKEKNDINIVVEKYSDMIYRLAAANVNSKSDADDVYQDVFLRYIKEVKKGKEFESEEHRKSWLIRVTINCCRSLNTSAWFRRTVPIDESITEEYDAFSDAGEDIHAALMKIPQKYRSVIHLFYYEQLSTDEIAETLDMKASTVRTQLTRAREMLRNIMKGELTDE